MKVLVGERAEATLRHQQDGGVFRVDPSYAEPRSMDPEITLP
jgi:hypothetical protein